MFNDDTDDLATLLTLIDMAGLAERVASTAVNGTQDDDSLGWYDETDTDRAVVCAAFHVLGQELLAHCEPTVVILITSELVRLRNATLIAMRELPR